MFSKDDASKVRADELILLYNVVRDTIGGEVGFNCDIDVSVNMGALFTEVIAEKRTKVPKGRDLDTSTCNVEKEFLDTNFLITCEILYDATTYRFTAKDKRLLFCRLPQPSLMDLEVAANVGFTVGKEYLSFVTRTTARSTPAPRRSTSTSLPAPPPAPTPDVHLSVEEIKDLEVHTGDVQRLRANIRRPYRSEYLLGDIIAEPEDAEYYRWMVDATKRNNSMLRRILHMLQKGCRSSHSTETVSSTAPAPPSLSSRPSTSALPSIRSAKRKKPVKDDGDDSDNTTSD